MCLPLAARNTDCLQSIAYRSRVPPCVRRNYLYRRWFVQAHQGSSPRNRSRFTRGCSPYTFCFGACGGRWRTSMRSFSSSRTGRGIWVLSVSTTAGVVRYFNANMSVYSQSIVAWQCAFHGHSFLVCIRSCCIYTRCRVRCWNVVYVVCITLLYQLPCLRALSSREGSLLLIAVTIIGILRKRASLLLDVPQTRQAMTQATK